MTARRSPADEAGRPGGPPFVHADGAGCTRTPARDFGLDALRLLAAFLVVAEHARAAVFIPWTQLEGGRMLLAPFYALTSMGHEAVMVFFALSGFLVGGQAIRRLRRGTFSARDYALRRLVRLWIVMIPA